MSQEQRIAEMIEPVIEDMGYELVRVKFMGAGRSHTLQLMIDHQDESKSITVEDCENVSNAVSALLDVEDPIENKYLLEVSSPGVDRPLTRLKDFKRYTGDEAKIELHTALDGRRRYRGYLKGVDEDKVIITVDGKDYSLPFEYIHEAKLVMTEALLKKASGE